MNDLKRMALLSIGASLLTMALKFGAYFLTDSVSLLSDAAESLVNLTASLIAFAAITVAARPADAGHAYGHQKVEYFSSAAEGALILVAAVAIIYTAVERFLHPAPLTHLATGIGVSSLAALVNFVAARMMLNVATRHDSITLEADAKHLLTDVWTSAGVLGGLGVVLFAPPSWQILDPIMAVVVALNIIATGTHLLQRSFAGLMDASLPSVEVEKIEATIGALLPPGASFHELRTRKAGARRFVEFHLLLPGATSVEDSHALCDRIEARLGQEFSLLQVSIHVEPLETHDGV